MVAVGCVVIDKFLSRRLYILGNPKCALTCAISTTFISRLMTCAIVCSTDERSKRRGKVHFDFALQGGGNAKRNALEPGTEVPVHHQPDKDETFVILRGKIRVTTYNDDGTVAESVILSQEDGCYGVNIPKNVWNTLEALEPNSCIFESKQGPFVPHEEEGVLKV